MKYGLATIRAHGNMGSEIQQFTSRRMGEILYTNEATTKQTINNETPTNIIEQETVYRQYISKYRRGTM